MRNALAFVDAGVECVVLRTDDRAADTTALRYCDPPDRTRYVGKTYALTENEQ